MKVLVTGATGFLGSWMCKKLLAEGIEVRILRRKNSDLSAIENLDLEHRLGDVTDKDSVLSAIDESIHSVFHLAGLIGYTRSLREQMQTINVEGTRNVVDACRDQRIERLVYMSSVVAIGASFDGKEPLNETSQYNIEHLNLGYFETKRQAEQIVKNACSDGQVDAVILNPSTVYGPGDARKGSRKTQLKVARGNFPFYTSGGVNIVSVKDVVNSTFNAWKTGDCGERYILGGENITIKRLFEYIAQYANTNPPKVFLPTPAVKILGLLGDQMERLGLKGPISSETAHTSTLFHWFDSTKAQTYLNHNPLPAAAPIKESVDWMKENSLI